MVPIAVAGQSAEVVEGVQDTSLDCREGHSWELEEQLAME